MRCSKTNRQDGACFGISAWRKRPTIWADPEGVLFVL